MNARQREFRDLQDRLRMSAADVAQLIGRARTTCLQYRSAGECGRTPPESVLVTMRAAWDEKQQQNLSDAIALIRSRGWDINWATLEETQDEVEPAVPEHGWRRPSFLPPAEKRKVKRTFQGDHNECEESGVRTHYCVRCGPISWRQYSEGEYRTYEFGDDAYGYAQLKGDRWCSVEGCDDIEEAA